MTDREATTPAPPEEESRLELAARWIRKRPAIIWIGLAGAAFLVATLSFWISDALILDDYVACNKAEDLGILGMANWYLFEFVGLYRPLTVPMLMGTAAVCEIPAIARAFGLVLHLVAAGLSFHLARSGLRWSRLPSALVSLAILFSPVAMAGAGWIAAGRGYPFSLALLLWMTLRLTTGKQGWWTALVGVAAVVVQEQTLFVVMFLIFVLTSGSVWRRVRHTSMAAIPVLGYFVILFISSKVLADAARFGSENGASIGNLFKNSGTWAEAASTYFPFGAIWRSFASGPFTTTVWIALLVLGIGTAVAAWQDRFDVQAKGPDASLPRDTPLRDVVVGLISLASAVLFVLPLTLAAVPWATPRVMYLPLAAAAFTVGAAVESLSLLSRRFAVVLGVAAIAAWALIVVPGVARDASAMTDSARQERAIAEEIALEGVRRDAAVVVLPSPPWVLAEEGTSVGDHLVQALAVPWAAGPAVLVLTEFDPEAVIVVRDLSICAGLDVIVNTNTGDRWPVDRVLIYDFGRRMVVPESETALALPACPSQ